MGIMLYLHRPLCLSVNSERRRPSPLFWLGQLLVLLCIDGELLVVQEFVACKVCTAQKQKRQQHLINTNDLVENKIMTSPCASPKRRVFSCAQKTLSRLAELL